MTLGIPDFDRVATQYDATRATRPEVLQALLAELKLHFPKGPRTLDAGCGTGRLLIPLQRAGWNTLGLDISKEMLKRAREKGARDLFRVDLRRLPLPDKRFDSALVVKVLHLLPDPVEAISEICRVCKVGLIAVATTSEGKNVHDDYREQLKARGLRSTVPSRSAFEILRSIASRRFINNVVSWESEVSADKELQELDQRLFSFQWEVPDAAHAEIMTLLRKRHAGQVFYVSHTAQVGYWYIRDLEASLAHQAGEWPLRPAAAA